MLPFDPVPRARRLLGARLAEGASIHVEALGGHASSRLYARLHLKDAPELPPTVMAMLLPDEALESNEAGAESEPGTLPFLETNALLDARGVPVPEVLASDLDARLILLEDLGDTMLEDRLKATPPQTWGALYEPVVDLLADMHARMAEIPAEHLVGRRRFARSLLHWEIEHFREYALEALGHALSRDAREIWDAQAALLADAVAALPVGFVHRDYQSRNVMCAPRGLVVIDHQDAMVGPRCYDLVALGCDSYVAIDEPLQQRLIARYAERRGLAERDVAREFWLIAAQRKLKDAGRFVFIDRVRHNPDFLRFFRGTIPYIARAIGHLPELAPLGRVLQETLPGYPDAVDTPASVGAP